MVGGPLSAVMVSGPSGAVFDGRSVCHECCVGRKYGKAIKCHVGREGGWAIKSHPHSG